MKNKTTSKTINEIVGANIKKLRLEKRLTQVGLGMKIYYCDTDISKIENGKRELSISELEKISKFFGVPIEDFFTKPEDN